MLYFAYGSNMSSKRLRSRVSSAKMQCIATLTEHQLQFHKRSKKDGSGKCDAFYTGHSTDRVMGIVFEMEAKDKGPLDEAEGLGKGYEEKTVTVKDSSGGSIQAFTYYATDIDPFVKPYHWYKNHVLIGAREHQLPTDYIQLIESVESIDDPLPNRHERELQIYKEPDASQL